ncbi:MAG: glycosyl hydrolase [Candidatus Kerfeldbacteria bacterium]
MKKIIIIVIISLLVIGACAWYLITDKEDGNNWEISENETFETSIIANDRFGFLVGSSAKEMELARETGAGWIRPHPGPFVWGEMQENASSEIDFSNTDNMIKSSATYDINILPTIWHYAEWDQQDNPNSNECIASTSEFKREFGEYRCVPYHWKEYLGWVSMIVERYDGDGLGDMPGLKKPITHWEIMNEPDLGTPDSSPGLQFLIGEPSDYAELLKRTSSAIRTSDPNATILIAGAAGGDESFLNYFREVFSDKETLDTFDIANVHCISNGDVDSFNTVPYAAMLAEFNINKPIWVTEAEAFQKDSFEQRKYTLDEQLLVSSINAFASGAEKIFFTSMNLDHIPGGDNNKPSKKDGPQASTEVYQKIFNNF